MEIWEYDLKCPFRQKKKFGKVMYEDCYKQLCPDFKPIDSCGLWCNKAKQMGVNAELALNNKRDEVALCYPTVEEVLKCYKEIEENISKNTIHSMCFVGDIQILQDTDKNYYITFLENGNSVKVDKTLNPLVGKLTQMSNDTNDIKFISKRFFQLLKEMFKIGTQRN